MIEEDVHGNRLTLPSGDYNRVQKKYYEKHNEHVFEEWRKVPSLWTFLKYRPNYVDKGAGHLTQMVCDGCTDFNFLYHARYANAPKHHATGIGHQWAPNVLVRAAITASFR